MNTQNSRCNFCGRTFSSAQGVRAHLKSCANYQRKKNNPAGLPRQLPRLPLREPRQLPRDLPAKPATRGAANKIAQSYTVHDNAMYFDDELQKERYHREQEELLRRQKEEKERRKLQEEQEAAARKRQEEYEQRKQKEEQESRERKRREVIQAVKHSVIDRYFTLSVIPNELKAKALLEIERVLETLPVIELPRSELIQIAEGIRDETYAPYLKSLEAKKSKQEEASEMGKIKLYSGIFFCPECDCEFELDRAEEKELVCDDCGTELEEVEEED